MEFNYSSEDIERAKNTNLVSLATAMGFTPVKIGTSKFSLKEMDSMRIYNEQTWCRWSDKSGGSQIDFLMTFGDAKTIPEAVHMLLEFQGITPTNISRVEIREAEKKEMVLPEKAKSYRIAYAYLMKQRELSIDVINYFVNDKKLLYEDKLHHNLVFLGKDPNGNIRYATKRGTGDIYGRKFKGDVEGNDKNYGINIVNLNSPVLKVFEASIDLMAYLDLTGDYQSNKLVLGMVADNPLIQFLKDYSHIKEINFCLDNDKAAKEQVYGKKEIIDESGNIIKERVPGYLEKYRNMGYTVKSELAPELPECKDYNEVLKYCKKNCPEKVFSLNRINKKNVR